MNRISFETVINFYPEHNAWAYGQLLSAIQDTTTVVPFVGAGLSAFCSYPSWPRVLTKMCGNIRDQSKQEIVRKQIEEGHLIETAQEILNGYPFFLRRFPEEFSPKLLEECSDAAMRSSAAWMLPYLFPEAPAVTTNFDQVLETVYERSQHRFTDILGPQQLCQRAQARQQRHHSLLKLHGSIGKTIDRNAIVFTEEQYNQAYQPESRLVAELTELFQNDTLLFLGCSLQMDRTLEVLKNLQPDGSYLTHFAILGCAPDKFDDRSEQLEKLGIIPIFYDDSDPRNHDSVRVILEYLLEETNSAAYKKLCSDCRSADPTAMSKRPLMFDSEYFPFSGRQEELARLTRFCEAENHLLWWSVTGPGGMGKSRLVFEFCKKMRTEGWKINRFEANPSRGSEAQRLEELSGWTPDVPKTIVVLDDVQAYMESVCAWMTRMDNTPRSEDLRILLLEREGTTIHDSTWLGSDFKNNHLDEWCHEEGFLRLDPLTDDQLMSVMTDYASAAGESLNAALLLKTLERVDPQFKRPLYAVAIADARCQGKDPTNWDRNKILDTLLDRELKFHQDRLQGIDGKKPGKSVRTELERLLAEVCIRGFLPLDQVDWTQYKFLSKRMEEAELEDEDFCKRLGILATVTLHGQQVDRDGNPIEGAVLDKEMKAIILSCPDLLKEHLVLKLALEKKALRLLPENWHLDPNRLIFLRRLFINYPDRLKDQTAFWDQFFSAPPVSDLPAWLYADLLWGCTDIFSPLAQRATDTLNKLHLANPEDETIAMCYAKGLFNLSNSQSPADRAATVVRLEKLYNDHSGNDEVAVAYASGLVNLSAVQSPADCADTVVRLQKLYHDHSGNDEVAVEYAKGLYNLTCDQSPDDRAAAVDRLEKLYDDHSGSDEVAVAYAKGLHNLSAGQSPKDRAAAVDRLERLYHDHSGNDEVAVEYAMGLHNLSVGQSPKDYAVTMDRLEKLYTNHSGNDGVAAQYANGLVIFAFFQTEEADVRRTLARSRAVLDLHSDHADIRLSHAKTWFNLTLVQEEAAIVATVSEIAAFLKAHPDAIPGFKEALVEYLSKHPDHADRYRPLSELGGDSHAK